MVSGVLTSLRHAARTAGVASRGHAERERRATLRRTIHPLAIVSLVRNAISRKNDAITGPAQLMVRA